MKIGDRLYISAGIAAREWGDCHAAFGYAWFYWRPHFHWNRGWPFSQKVCSGGVSWLNFFFSIDFWPTWVRSPEMQAASERKSDANPLT